MGFHRKTSLPSDPALPEARKRAEEHLAEAHNYATEANLIVSRLWRARERNHIGPAFAAMYDRTRGK